MRDRPDPIEQEQSVAEARAPLIYISYGMTKSGSTLAFELTKAILDENGRPQKRLSQDAIPGSVGTNFVQRLYTPQLEAIEAEAARLGYPIVLKTHLTPTADVKAWVREGRIQGHCVYRDLREMALSMMDHGARARAKGEKAFANIGSLDDALRGIRKQVPRFQEWAELPGFISLYYEDVAFDTQATVLRLCRQLGLEADPAKVERTAKSERFTQYNKAVPGRHREMAPEDSARVLAEFRRFYAERIESRNAPAKPLQSTPRAPLGRLWGLLRRL